MEQKDPSRVVGANLSLKLSGQISFRLELEDSNSHLNPQVEFEFTDRICVLF